MPDNLQTHAPDEAWNHPKSLGFSTWRRHTIASQAARMPLIQRRPEGGFEAMYERHASFAGGLLARKTNQAGPYVRPGNFVFGMGQHREPRTKAFKEIPDMQRLPAMRYSISGGTAPAMNGGNSIPGTLSFAPAGGTHNDPVTGSAGLSVQAKSTPLRVLAPEDQTGGGLAQVVARPKAAPGPLTFERTGQGHIARKAALSGYPQTANASANNAHIGDAFSRSNAKRYQGQKGTESIGTPLPVSMDATVPGSARSHTLPDVSSHLPVQRSISFAYRYPVDLESRPQLPLTLRSGASGVIARQSQNNGWDRTVNHPLESYRIPAGRTAFPEIIRRKENPAVSETESRSESALPENLTNERAGEMVSKRFIPDIAPSGSTRPRQITAHHGDGRVRHDEYVLHRLPVSSPMITMQRNTSSTQSPLRLAPMHLTGTSRLSGPTLQPLNGRFHRSPEKQPVGDALPITRGVALQRFSTPGAPDTPSNLPDVAGIHMPLPQAHQHDNVPILRETIAQSAGSIMMSRAAAATGGTDIVPHMDRPATHPKSGPASHIPLQRAAHIPQAPPLVQRLPGNESPWSHWEPSSPGAARHRNMPFSARELSRPTSLHLTEAIRPSRMVSQSPREPITERIHASLNQANRHDLRQHGNRPILRKAIAQSTGNTGMNAFFAAPAVADAMLRQEHSTAHADGYSHFAEFPPITHGLGHSGTDLQHKPAVAGNARASGALPATTTFSATPSTAPAVRRFAASIEGMRPMAQQRLQNNSHSIASIPETPPDARRKWAAPRSTGHEDTGSSHAGTTLAGNIGIAENQHGVSPYQETWSAQSGWTSGAAGRPLVMARRTSGQLMRATDDMAGAPAYSPSSATPEDRYGVAPAPQKGLPEAHGTSGSETPDIAAPSRGEPDPDEIAEQAWRIMVERLVIEQERRGLAKWP